MTELNHGMLTYKDDPNPHIGSGPTWPEFLKAWRDMEAKGWPSRLPALSFLIYMLHK